jgi:hypothetical protein
LLDLLAHTVPHWTSGGEQLNSHLPATQASPDRHAFPQLPQFWRSLDVSAVQEPESSPESPEPPSSLEHAANNDRPARIAPPNSHLGNNLFVLTTDRMTEPFMMFDKLGF